MIALYLSLSPSFGWGRSAAGPSRSARHHRARLAVVAAVTATATLFTVGTPANAVPTSTGTEPAGGTLVELDRRSTEPDQVALAAAVRKLQPYVHRTTAGTFRVDAPADVVASIPVATYARLMDSSRLVNLDIRAGRLVSVPDGRVLLSPALLPAGATVRADGTVVSPGRPGGRAAEPRLTAAEPRLTAAEPLPAAEPDRNTLKVEWWGVQIHLDKATAQMLIGILQAAATVTSVMSLLVSAGLISAAAAVPLAVVGGILAIVSAALAACLTDDGLNLSITWLAFGWCTKP